LTVTPISDTRYQVSKNESIYLVARQEPGSNSRKEQSLQRFPFGWMLVCPRRSGEAFLCGPRVSKLEELQNLCNVRKGTDELDDNSRRVQLDNMKSHRTNRPVFEICTRVSAGKVVSFSLVSISIFDRLQTVPRGNLPPSKPSVK
jgi:hypothetical protein